MPEKIHNIAKNTSYFTIALVLQKVISFTYFAVLASALTPGELGKYYFAISFSTIFSVFIDVGMANVLTREIAKSKEDANKLLSNSLAVRIPLSIISFLIVVILINFLSPDDPLTRTLVYFSAACMVFDSFTLGFFSVIRGFHNLKFESISSVVFQFIVLCLGLLIIKSELGLIWQMSALTVASFFILIYSMLLIKFKWKLKFFQGINIEFIKSMAVIALPFAVFGILQRLLTYSDSIFLKFMAGDEAVGFYQFSFKIIFALQFLPMAFVASLYPAFSSYWKNNREQLAVSFERAINYLVMISLPISLGIAILSDRVVFILNPGYYGAILPLRIAIFSLFFIFINFPIGSLLNATDRQKINTSIMAAGLALSVAANLVLIPKYGAAGAATTVLLVNLFMFILGALQVPKIIKYRVRKNFIMLVKVFVASAIMSFAVWKLKYDVNIFLLSATGGVIYFIILFILKGIKKEDLSSILKSFKK
ncbi:MAG: flippase [bacterium]